MITLTEPSQAPGFTCLISLNNDDIPAKWALFSPLTDEETGLEELDNTLRESLSISAFAPRGAAALD